MDLPEPSSGNPLICGGSTATRFVVTADILDPSAVAALLSDPSTGALATFTGLVRSFNAGRRVTSIEYEAHESMARRVFERIAGEAGSRWPDAALAIHHRIGRLVVGEASIVIAAASPHRAEAFAVCRFAIERVKQIAPIWKHEQVEGGEVWVEGALADPDDAAALETAFQRACA